MTDLADPGALISVAAVTDQARADAAAYLTRKGYEDLLPMLGLGVPEEPRGAKAVACPSCGAAVGTGCRSADSRVVRSHQARIRHAVHVRRGVVDG